METVDHLLICYPVASRLWMFIVAVFGLAWVQPGTVRAVLQTWVGGKGWKEKVEDMDNGWSLSYVASLVGA